MARLKIKNQQGGWDEIVAIRGQDGAIQYKAGDGIKIENDTITAEVTKQYVDKSIAELTDMGFTPEVVGSLPTENIKTNIIYMLPAQTSEAENIYEEWMYINNKWEMIGSTSVDLTNYYTKNEANAKLDTKQNKLTPGENITIDENNIISASGGETIPYTYAEYGFFSGGNRQITDTVFIANVENIITKYLDKPKTVKRIGAFTDRKSNDTNPVYMTYSCYNKITTSTTSFTFHGDTSYFMIYNNEYQVASSVITVSGTWSDNKFRITSCNIKGVPTNNVIATNSTALLKNNTTSFTPTGDYHPATKKYVDDITKNINNELSMLPQNLVDNGFEYNTHEQANVQVNYTIENISTSHGFELNENGYYESNNKGVGNSYSLCKVTFNNEQRLLIPISYINSGENNYDYGIFSNVDKELSNNNAGDGVTGSETVFKNCKGESSTDVKELTYEIPAGEHFIYIKYRKDGGGDNANDSLQFKIPTEVTNNIYENRKMATTKYVDDSLNSIPVSGIPMDIRQIHTSEGNGGYVYGSGINILSECKDIIDSIINEQLDNPVIYLSFDNKGAGKNKSYLMFPSESNAYYPNTNTNAEYNFNTYNHWYESGGADTGLFLYVVTLEISGSWKDGVFTTTRAMVSATGKYNVYTINQSKSNFLAKTNTKEFTPTADYHPATKKYVDDAVSNIGASGGSAKGYYYVEAPMGALGIGNEYNESNTLPETCHQVFKDFIDTINSNNVREPKLIVANTVDETTDINGNPITNPMPRYIELLNLHKDTAAEEGKSHYILKGVCNTPRGAKNANGDDIDFIATVDIVGVDSNTGFTVENVFVYLGVYTMPSASGGSNITSFYTCDATGFNGSSPENIYDANSLENARKIIQDAYEKGYKKIGVLFNADISAYSFGATDTSKQYNNYTFYTYTISNGLSASVNFGQTVITGKWENNVFTCTKIANRWRGSGALVTSSEVLTKTNTTGFTPTGDYHPATKKYVDDSIANISTSGEVDLSNYYTKSEVDTSLSGKANTNHTHTKSEITDFPTIPSKTSELTNDSGFLTSHQDISGKLDTSTYNAKMSEIDSSINTLNTKSHQVLYGTETPTSSQGNNGDIYIKYEV